MKFLYQILLSKDIFANLPEFFLLGVSRYIYCVCACTHTYHTWIIKLEAKRGGKSFILLCRENGEWWRHLIICSLGPTTMSQGNGLILSDQTLKPSHLKAPESYLLHQDRKGVWNSSSPALAPGSRWLSSSHSPSLWVFLYIPAQFEKNTRSVPYPFFEQTIIFILVNFFFFFYRRLTNHQV